MSFTGKQGMSPKEVRKISAVTITNLRTGKVIGTRVAVAHSFWLRFRGLMGTSVLPVGQGMLFPHTNSIHMFFMKYPLCIAYLTKDFRVLRQIVLNPWQIGPVVRKAYWVLELPQDLQDMIATGDLLHIEKSILSI